MSAGKYASVMIAYDDNIYDDNGEVISIENRRILLDAVEETSISATSNVTTHPIVTGDMVGDHMIKEPITFSINGEISKNGSNNFIYHSGFKSRIQAAVSKTIKDMSFAEIEKLFEDIKDKGLLCEVTKTVSGQEFRVRENMALTSIQWRERINSLSFNFTFTQVFVVDVVQSDLTDEEQAALIEDENLPNITAPNILSFGQFSYTTKSLDIDYVCYQAGLLSTDFYLHVHMKDKSTVLANIANQPVTELTHTQKVIGENAGFIDFVVTGLPKLWWTVSPTKFIYDTISSAVETSQGTNNTDSVKEKQFENWEDTSEIDRYFNFKDRLLSKLNTLNNKVYVYNITENQPQICTINIGGTQYDFTFKRNNLILGKETWYVTVTKNLTNIEVRSAYAVCAGKTSLDECTASNVLFMADGGQYVYVVQTESGDLDDLRNYGIFVSALSPQEISQEVKKIVESEIYY